MILALKSVLDIIYLLTPQTETFFIPPHKLYFTLTPNHTHRWNQVVVMYYLQSPQTETFLHPTTQVILYPDPQPHTQVKSSGGHVLPAITPNKDISSSHHTSYTLPWPPTTHRWNQVVVIIYLQSPQTETFLHPTTQVILYPDPQHTGEIKWWSCITCNHPKQRHFFIPPHKLYFTLTPNHTQVKSSGGHVLPAITPNRDISSSHHTSYTLPWPPTHRWNQVVVMYYLQSPRGYKEWESSTIYAQPPTSLQTEAETACSISNECTWKKIPTHTLNQT